MRYIIMIFKLDCLYLIIVQMQLRLNPFLVTLAFLTYNSALYSILVHICRKDELTYVGIYSKVVFARDTARCNSSYFHEHALSKNVAFDWFCCKIS